jgi:hypothetical protein
VNSVTVLKLVQAVFKKHQIAAGTKVQPYSVFENAIVGENTKLVLLLVYVQVQTCK